MARPFNRVMEVWLFDTCNFRCGYCSLVETGQVFDKSQLQRYKDPAFLDRIVGFFDRHSDSQNKWLVIFTGGEPFLAPNFAYLCRTLGESGHKIAIYTNLSLALERSGFLEQVPPEYIDYIQASLHPDWEGRRQEFFNRLESLKSQGYRVVCRFVAHPRVLEQLPELQQECHRLKVGFLPTTLFDPRYPAAYTSSEYETIANFTQGYSSLLQLDGGLLVEGRECMAADRLFATMLHRGGNITPCISTTGPVLGNILEGRLNPIEGPSYCFSDNNLCTCDIHFQQNVVLSADDSDNFSLILEGRGENLWSSYQNWRQVNGLTTSNREYAGQGVELVAGQLSVKALQKTDRAAYQRWKDRLGVFSVRKGVWYRLASLFHKKRDRDR